ncbi:MAG: TonB-dependent receptor [Acidobacteriia bacterium]|nr:TonB-dependent receptor [Terriglobia bacterium]
MTRLRPISLMVVCSLLALFVLQVKSYGQGVTATLTGYVYDVSGGAVTGAKVTVVNVATGFARTALTTADGNYALTGLPTGTYRIRAEQPGFGVENAQVTLQVGQEASLNFTVRPGTVAESVAVSGESPLVETTKTQVSSVIVEKQIADLPVNGRDFISFTLLSPAVQIGNSTSGSTDAVVESGTHISFAGQSIHFNFVAVDGADNISTASQNQRATPSQEAVQEFRVINTDYSAEFGRSNAGIVNIITKSGTNDWHGSLYEYFRNNVMDATGLLDAPGLHTLRQNQFGAVIGGPLRKDQTFFLANYEGQRRGESPFYNKIVLANIDAINQVKVNIFGLPAEPARLDVLRTNNNDNGFVRFDHNFGKNYLYTRYFVTDARMTNLSPLNNGFDLPSAFKHNFIRDQSLVISLATNLSAHWGNELRGQFARRSFDFPTATTQPHLEVANEFAIGVNRGNPDYYREQRFELQDSATWTSGHHTVSFGGDFNFVKTDEKFVLWYPFEADFPSVDALLGTGAYAGLGPTPSVLFFMRLQAPNYTEPSFNPTIFQGSSFPDSIKNQVQWNPSHTYEGFYVQDKWRAGKRLTLNGGVRWDFETWPSGVFNTKYKNFDPRIGLAYDLGTSRKIVVRAGFGLYHGIILSEGLYPQGTCCGGQAKYSATGSNLNAPSQLYAFASSPQIMNIALGTMLQGLYPDGTPMGFCPGGVLAGCGYQGLVTVTRWDANTQKPYGLQTSLGVDFEPIKNTAVNVTFLHVRGVHLGNFYNVNQPDPSGQVLVHDSKGNAGYKNMYFVNWMQACGSFQCPGYSAPPPVGPPLFPGERNPVYAIYFEYNSRFDSQYDALLLNVQKRTAKYLSYGFSYTYSKTIDDDANPTFAAFPQDTGNFRAERALSPDDVRHRAVLNVLLTTPSEWPVLLRDFTFSTITTLQSPHHFNIYAGSDVNGDVFNLNDRAGLEGRSTFQGDSLRTVDVGVSRSFHLTERIKGQFRAEAFNVLNTLNIVYFNTVYGAADFCPAGGPNVCGSGPLHFQGSPDPVYGTPSAVANPRQLQFSLRFSF